MINKALITLLLTFAAVFPVFADQASDQDYINKLYYRNNKLMLEVRKRTVDEIRNYSNTDINTTMYRSDSYSFRNTDIYSSSVSRAETKQITEWYLYKGAISEMSDFDFLAAIGDRAKLDDISKTEDNKLRFRNIGNITIGIGVAGMIGGSALSANQSLVTSSALIMAAGFFFNAFNQSPQHYITANYAQNKIAEYNIDLKRKLNLPLEYE